ncbi:MAG: hypothetical protein K8J31_08705, partial [Anaerolineae bacterium]|nr:hypothetical protein [Anaerolineae bacterium]
LKTWPLALLSILLGTCLAGFFWIPAVFEHDLVRWIERPALLRMSVTALFSPLDPLDLNALIPEPQMTLGRTIVPITILAAVSIVLTGKRSLIHGLFVLAAGGFLLLGIGPFPRATWLLGCASLCLAVGAAALVPVRIHFPPKWRRIYPAFLLTLALILALPVLQVPHWPSTFGDIQPIDQITYEQQGAGIAVLPGGYPLPLTLPEILPPNRLLLSGYEADNIIKIIPAQATNRSQINLISHETHRVRYQVAANVRTPVNMLTAFFPGWQAFAAGQSIPLAADARTGLMTFDIPPMNGELVVTLGPTSVRQWAWIISGGAVFMLLALTGWRARRPHEHLLEGDLLGAPEARLLSLIVGAFALITVIFTTPNSPVNLYAPPGYGLQNAIPARFDTNVGLEILGYDVDGTEARPGDSVQVTLYWQALRTLAANYQVQITLADYVTGTPYFQTALHAPGDYPTSRWRTYLYVKDTDRIQLPDSLPFGTYEISVDVFDCSPACGNRLTFFNANGQNVGQTLVLPVHLDVVP